uniref:ion channel n=1 Tax=Sphingobium bisphenolivorans TaxID=1335760 RepID=UPI0003B583FF
MGLTTQLAIATATVAVTVLVHLIGLAGLLAILRRHRHASQVLIASFVNGVAILLAAFGLFALHAVEIWLWAALYLLLNAFPNLEQALYFSTSTYVTIGYGDVVLPVGSRILGSVAKIGG